MTNKERIRLLAKEQMLQDEDLRALLTSLSEEEEQLSFHSYLAFGPYIAIAIIVYLTLFDGIKYLAGLYLNLF